MNRIQIEFDELVEDEPKTSASAAEDDAAILASKILVVDDSPTTRELMRGCLIASGFSQVEVAGDGAEALRLAERNAPDLVVLDLAMPVLDGFDTCAALRRRSETRDVPVLVQSATEKFSDVTRAFDVGATDILGKPFKPIELTTRMRVHLENRQMIKRLVSYRTRVAQELDAAREMQQFLCPDPYMKRAASERHRVEIGSVYRPSSEIGGDIWGMIDADDYLCLYLADFAGHGVPAAMNTFRLNTLIARISGDAEAHQPERALAYLNDALCDSLAPGQFATLIWARLDRRTGVLAYSTAGAPPPLIWPAGPHLPPRYGACSGLPCGFVKGVSYERREIETGPDFRFMMYSDALIEARDPSGEMIGEEGLLGRIGDAGEEQGVDSFIDAILYQSIDGDAVSDDDLTVIALAMPAEAEDERHG